MLRLVSVGQIRLKVSRLVHHLQNALRDYVAHKRTALIPVQRIEERANGEQRTLGLGEFKVHGVLRDIGVLLRQDGFAVWSRLKNEPQAVRGRQGRAADGDGELDAVVTLHHL